MTQPQASLLWAPLSGPEQLNSTTAVCFLSYSGLWSRKERREDMLEGRPPYLVSQFAHL